MRTFAVFLGLFACVAASASAQEVTWRKDIQPIVAAKCGGCHGASQPEFAEWNVRRVTDKNLAPRVDTYPLFMNDVVWPETGALIRRRR